jgi:hypothetical protein
LDNTQESTQQDNSTPNARTRKITGTKQRKTNKTAKYTRENQTKQKDGTDPDDKTSTTRQKKETAKRQKEPIQNETTKERN